MFMTTFIRMRLLSTMLKKKKSLYFLFIVALESTVTIDGEKALATNKKEEMDQTFQMLTPVQAQDNQSVV